MNNEDEKNYQKAIYSFQSSELAKLMPWDMQIQLGAIAEKVLAGILRDQCLKRVGVKNSPDTKVEYDMVNGNFTVYVPKIWCAKCNNRKAEFEYENKPYCINCAKELRETLATKPVSEKGKKKGK